MMWTRKELKQRAKDALKRNYWKIVLVTTLAMFLGGGLSYSLSTSHAKTGSIIAADVTEEPENVEDGFVEQEEALNGSVQDNRKGTIEASETMGHENKMILGVSIVIFVLIFTLIVCALMFAFIELLYNPFYVGVQRFLLKSIDDTAQVKEIVYGFDHSYKNIVKTMFYQDIQIFLWTLLFVVPGIYKKYQYRMVSYILAEHPEMNYKEALQMSKDMMNGEKWHAFVLDFSFIPWNMLCIITCGIAGVFYVEPYMELTNAALYRTLEKGGRDDEI